ncbi:hypothetical protein BJ138DRAFT_1070145 [Hygrophoropsis aurantiaca]|uniref:Uncharacterized protein n=1 Tax=Hygrophoropsis aurantiaca TaxID=72124 RepID=A0ACB8A2I4_9AGAM|nr:hypothetical protein BJ138DRAFT_1070145 [Hygrophoropsis aurantiaca]
MNSCGKYLVHHMGPLPFFALSMGSVAGPASRRWCFKGLVGMGSALWRMIISRRTRPKTFFWIGCDDELMPCELRR